MNVVKKFNKLFILFTLISFSLFQHGAVLADTITVRADPWYPYNGDPKSKHPGYMIEIAQLAWAEAGHKLDYQILDWDETLKRVKAGKIDCAVGVGKEEAPGLVYPKQTMGVMNTGFFRLTDSASWKYSGVASLKGKRIGIIDGYTYDEAEIDAYLETKPADLHIAGGDTPLEDLANKMANGELDVIIESITVFKATTRKMGINFLFKGAGKIDSVSAVYVACSDKNKSSQQYADLIDKKLSQLRANGGLQKMLDEYGLEDWQ